MKLPNAWRLPGGVDGVAMVVQAALPGPVESFAAGLPDGLTAALVFVVGGDVADRFG